MPSGAVHPNSHRSWLLMGSQPQLGDAIFDNGPYDLILCSEVLEHVSEWDFAFANFRELLAKSGHVIITCPHFFALHEEPFDFWRPTPYAISFFAAKHGLEVDSEERLGTGWDVLGTLLARMRLTPTKLTFRARLLARLSNYAKGWLFSVLNTGELQANVRDIGPFFLSNCFVLKNNQE